MLKDIELLINNETAVMYITVQFFLFCFNMETPNPAKSMIVPSFVKSVVSAW